MSSESLVLSSVENRIASVVLNRPKALNALNLEMVQDLIKQYREWSHASDVAAVVLSGAGGKALCAGGDVKTIAQQVARGEWREGLEFFVVEYELDYLVATLPVPHVALMDGIVFGGGVGLSVHGGFQVATERSLFAMPECAIGLYPDVGGSHFLPRLPGGVGRYLGLTGYRLRGADLVRAGVASHYVPSKLVPSLIEGIRALGGRAAAPGVVRGLLDRFQAEGGPLPPGELDGDRPRIDAVFGAATSVEDVHDALEKDASGWAKKTLALINQGSPLSQKLTFEQLRRGATKTLRECLSMEHNMMSNLMTDVASDFVVGVTAKLIEKTNDPKWRHASVRDVTQADVDWFFRPLPAGSELVLEAGATSARL